MAGQDAVVRRGRAASVVSAVLASGLAKSYGDAPALGPVDLDIASGERVALLGHNGSGKTTLLRITAGLLDATAGHGCRARPSGRLPRRPGVHELPR